MSKRPPLTRATVLIDTREKFPAMFPSTLTWYIDGDVTRPFNIGITTKRERLTEGDLALDGFKNRCLIEKKGCLTELWQNHCTNDKGRYLNAIDRLTKAAAHPYLWVTTSTHDLLNPNPLVMYPDHVLQRMMAVVAASNLRLLLWPPASTPKLKRRQGAMLLNILLTHAFYPDLDSICKNLAINSLQKGLKSPNIPHIYPNNFV